LSRLAAFEDLRTLMKKIYTAVNHHECVVTDFSATGEAAVE
jgi:hypothetical protein